MQNSLIRKFSLLGLLLTIVSALTAFVFASSNKTDVRICAHPGSLTFTSNGCILTCTPTANISIEVACNVTAESGTTGIDDGSITNCTTIGDCN